MADHLSRGADPPAFAAANGMARGVSGYAYHTVPAALYCWLRARGDFEQAVESVVLLGGDTDSTAALTGALCGAARPAGIPPAWLAGLCDYPRSAAWLATLGDRLHERFAVADDGGRAAPGPLPLKWPALAPRNALFATVVLAHGVRRLLPPY
jgi:hypothetical protein